MGRAFAMTDKSRLSADFERSDQSLYICATRCQRTSGLFRKTAKKTSSTVKRSLMLPSRLRHRWEGSTSPERQKGPGIKRRQAGLLVWLIGWPQRYIYIRDALTQDAGRNEFLCSLRPHPFCFQVGRCGQASSGLLPITATA